MLLLLLRKELVVFTTPVHCLVCTQLAEFSVVKVGERGEGVGVHLAFLLFIVF